MSISRMPQPLATRSLDLAPQAFAEVYETSLIAEALALVNEKTLLVLDIDNTLMEPVQELGSDQWYEYLLRHYREQERLSEAEVYERATRRWNDVQKFVAVRAVESDTPKLLRELQNKGVKTLLLTARNVDVTLATHKQLASIGLDPASSAAVLGEDAISEGGPFTEPVRYEQGVIFGGETNDKGAVLVEFLRRHQLTPERIVFIDDKLKHVQRVAHEVPAQLGIPCLCVRYGACDGRVQVFDSRLVEIQERFGESRLSNEEAANILRSESAKS